MSISAEELLTKPFVDGKKVLINGSVLPWESDTLDVTSPILDSDGKRVVIGSLAQMGEAEAVAAVDAAKNAFKNGTGHWPQLKTEERITAIENLVAALRLIRDQIINVLMWEICKNTADAAAEFDRTMAFIDATIKTIRTVEKQNHFMTVAGVQGKFKRAAIGVMCALGPYNYPFNETYTTLIPSLLMGNTVVMKIPATGGLAHVLTMEAYAANLPPGVMNFVSGSGKVTMGPIMRAGIDIFAFIGGSKTADILLKEHPAPHRLKVWLSLEGKNLGIVTADADIDNAVEQCALGSLTYNGQRCTAIKLIFLHESVSEQFITKFKARVATLKSGMPWTEGVLITPLPELKKPTYLTELLEDAVSKGAVIVNAAEGGGVKDGNLMTPAIVTGVTVDMRLWHEEQFGPVVPIAVYSDVSEVVSYINTTSYGQQAAIFSMKEETVAPLMDILSTAVGRININTQCARSPDVFPFSGRRSSALGTLSITEALIAFSTETVVAGKANDINDAIMKNCIGISNFLAPVMTPR